MIRTLSLSPVRYDSLHAALFGKHTYIYTHTYIPYLLVIFSLQLLSTLRQISILHQPALHIRPVSLQPARFGVHGVGALLEGAVEALGCDEKGWISHGFLMVCMYFLMYASYPTGGGRKGEERRK